MEPTRKAKGGSKPRERKRGQNHPKTSKDPDASAQIHHQNGPLPSNLGQQSSSAEESVGPPASRSITKQRRAAQGSSESSCVSDGSTLPEVGDGAVSLGERGGQQSRPTPRKKLSFPNQCRQRGDIQPYRTPDGSPGIPSRKLRRAREPREQCSQSRGSLAKATPLRDPGSPRDGEEQGTKKKRKKRRKPKADAEETEQGPGRDREGGQKPSSSQEKSKVQQLRAVNMSSPGSSSSKRSRGCRAGRRRLFEDYMSLRAVSAGLKRGELIQGTLRINPKKYHEAFVPSPDGSADIFLDGLLARNRALNGDVVVVKLLPPEQWKVENREERELVPPGNGSPGQGKPRDSSPDVIVEAQYNDDDEEVGGKMEAMSLQDKAPATPDGAERTSKLSTSDSASEKLVQRTGKVVYITELKHSRAASGFIKFLPDKTFAMFSPVDHRVPRINVPLADCPVDFTARPGDYANTLFICRVTHWPADNTFAEGRLVKSLGQAGEIEPETEGILDEYDVDCSDFPTEALSCLPQNLPWTIPAEELAKRRDLRQECVFTVDPATARDLDDALSCKQLPDGNFEVGVHIADVSYFVEEGSALDVAASQRATSVYLVQKVVPMLPRLLCEELCSLNPQTDRLTFSVIWTLSPEGKILSEWFGRSVICSCIKLSYDHAQSMIDAPDKPFSPEELPPCAPEQPLQRVHQAVLHLHAIAQHLRAQRFSDGALRLDQMKLAFCLDADSGMPQGCYVYQYRDSNKLVEEFMLLANMAVAHRVYRANSRLALLRRHPPPQGRMVEALQELCLQLGLHVDLSSSGALHKSLNDTVGDDQYSAARKEVLTHLCSRPMQMAVYFCAGILQDEKLFRHYALNVPLYTHFTSPIRRYADLIVHRLLAASLKCGPPLCLSDEEVHKQAAHCNDKKMASKRVQELSSELFFSIFVRECGPLDSEAMVMGMLDKAFDVLVLSYGVQKRIYCNGIEGLQSFHFRKVGKRPEMTLVWSVDDPGQEPVSQEISLFSLLRVQLKADGAPLKYSAVLQRPAPPQP